MCEKPDIFSVNIFSIGNPAKLHSLIKKYQVLKKTPSSILCIQEAKISKHTHIHLSLLDKYNVLFDFIPGSINSGGFLTLWSSNLSPAKRIASSIGFQLLKFVRLDWFVINVYANPNSFQATMNSLKLSIRFLPNKSKIIMTGDFNALSYDNCNSRLLRSHMRLKKNRPYNHWLKSQGHYLSCFSTSKRSEPIRFACDMRLKTRYSLKTTTKIRPTLGNKNVPILRSQNTQNTRTPLKTGSEQSAQLLFIRQRNFDPFQMDQPKTLLIST